MSELPAEANTGTTYAANSVFEQPWWLDAVAPGHWSEAVVRHDGGIVARLPYAYRKVYGLTTITQPPLTQTLGPWLRPPTGRYARQLEMEKRYLAQLIEQLPNVDHFRMNFSPALTNWLPFYWAGFRATVRYTYRIDDLTDLDRVKSEFMDDVRRGIKKGTAAVAIDPDYPIEDLLRLAARTQAQQGLGGPSLREGLRRLEAAAASRGARRVLGAVDAQGRTHAALMIVWDEKVLYALVNARDPEVQAFGANTLLFWEAIRIASQVSKAFDFEGSMVEPIEHFFRGFGGRQTPYFSISRTSPRARSMLALRSSGQRLEQLRSRRRP
jgi:Acetyltransferase (GNAT) domain